MSVPPGQINVEHEFSDKLTVHKNLGQEVIVTTMDKIRLCLMRNEDAISHKHEWKTPLGLLLSFVTTLVAADFKQFVVSADVWQALFIFASVICVIWLLSASRAAWKNRSAGDIENIVRELAAQQPKAAAAASQSQAISEIPPSASDAAV